MPRKSIVAATAQIWAIVVIAVTVTAAAPAQEIVSDRELISDSDVDACYAAWAIRMHITPVQLNSAVARSGIDASALKDLVRAEITRRRVSDPSYCRK